jgi:hypothetical protein
LRDCLDGRRDVPITAFNRKTVTPKLLTPLGSDEKRYVHACFRQQTAEVTTRRAGT